MSVIEPISTDVCPATSLRSPPPCLSVVVRLSQQPLLLTAQKGLSQPIRRHRLWDSSVGEWVIWTLADSVSLVYFAAAVRVGWEQRDTDPIIYRPKRCFIMSP